MRDEDLQLYEDLANRDGRPEVLGETTLELIGFIRRLAQREPTLEEMKQALGEFEELPRYFVHPIGWPTIRKCRHCGKPVPGGPTACVTCVWQRELDGAREERTTADRLLAEFSQQVKDWIEAAETAAATGAPMPPASWRCGWCGVSVGTLADRDKGLADGKAHSLTCEKNPLVAELVMLRAQAKAAPRETQTSISTWENTTFAMAGLVRSLTADGDSKAAENIADVAIVLYRLATELGVDLHEEIDKKMAINRGGAR